MTEIELPQGTLRYRESGSGPETVVLLHGIFVDGRLWDGVAAALVDGHRVLVPDLPLGVHTRALNAAADRSPAGIARLVADFLEALDLRDVTLVGNDSGGMITQLVALNHPERVARVVLTPCDGFEIFPPALFKPLVWSAKLPGGLTGFLFPLKLRVARKLPIAFGWLTKKGIPTELGDEWVRAYFADAGVRRDIRGFLRAASPKVSKAAGARLGEFAKPVLVAWAPDDRFFEMALGERLAAAFPDARMERIEDAYTFVPIDQPQRTAQLIRDFVRSSGGEGEPLGETEGAVPV